MPAYDIRSMLSLRSRPEASANSPEKATLLPYPPDGQRSRPAKHFDMALLTRVEDSMADVKDRVIVLANCAPLRHSVKVLAPHGNCGRRCW